MRLPNAEAAFIDLQKLTDYVLSSTHPRGGYKAEGFRRALHMHDTDAVTLRQLLKDGVREADATLMRTTDWGTLYSADVRIEWRGRRAMVRTAWIIRNDEYFPRLTTAYIISGNRRES